jgi:hypothetical protein
MTALAIGSLALSAFGQVKAGKAAKEAGKSEHAAADAQAGLLDYNAQIADAQAADAITRGQEEENRYRQGVRTLIGSQRAGFAGQGVDIGVGSAVDVQADTAYLGELDALTLRTNAAREAWGFRTQATDLRNRARVTRQTGIFAEQGANAQGNAAYVGAAATGLAGTVNLLERRYGFGRTAA